MRFKDNKCPGLPKLRTVTVRYRHRMIDFTNPDSVRLAIALASGLFIGFALGYAIRAFISFRRRKAAMRRRWQI